MCHCNSTEKVSVIEDLNEVYKNRVKEVIVTKEIIKTEYINQTVYVDRNTVQSFKFKVGTCPMFYFVIILTSVVLVAMYYMWVLDRHDKLNDRVLLAKDSSFHQLNEVNPDKEGLANGEKLTSTNDKIQFPTLNSKFSLVEGLVQTHMIFGIMSTFIPGLPRYIRMLVEYFYVIYGISLSLYLANK